MRHIEDDRDQDVRSLPREEVHAADVSTIRKILTYDVSLSDAQYRAFTDMRDVLGRSRTAILSTKQRTWALAVLDQYEPQYTNDFSAGKVPRGKEVTVNVGLKPLRPPGRSSR